MSTETQREKLKQHFAKRVTNQARIVLNTWQKLKEEEWQNKDRLLVLMEELSKLEKYAARFEVNQYLAPSLQAAKFIQNLAQNDVPFSESDIEVLNQHLSQIGDNTLRKTDHDTEQTTRTFIRTPIYLALNDQDIANRVIKQMEFFGFRAVVFHDPVMLIQTASQDKPETIVIDVDFGGHTHEGIETIKSIQSNHESPIPILFTSEEQGDIETRLKASRCGGEEFFYRAVDPGQLIEKIEEYTHASPQDPYKVLVVDDSKAQAKFIENILKKAGMLPCVITDPMQILIALDDFSPEIIIMDMYMPGCTGMELARVIRQQDRFHSVPILYLSAEDDVNKQLHAMSLGGDDFLTKPINPRHLVATIHNRGRRARSLIALMIRDSLTGLYNHTHTLHLLDLELTKAKQKQTIMSFAMLDIDFFKKINDNYGHPIGDRVLKSLSLFLKQRLRKSDHIGRYGGEEFAIVLPNTSESDAKRILNEIREKFSELHQPAGDAEFQVTFSCGVASSRYITDPSQSLSEMADKALYEAKHAGRNKVRCYRPE
jgi:diguanylate cyclase (GGDEF)-like protein